VNDAARVRRDERARDRETERDALVDRHRRFGEAIGEVVPVEPLHREVEAPVRERAVRDELHDARIAKLREQTDLALEARALRVSELAHHFERDERPGLHIARAVDRSHSSAAMERDDLEAAVDAIAGRRALHAEQPSVDGRAIG
jgi:hypothetical protein